MRKLLFILFILLLSNIGNSQDEGSLNFIKQQSEEYNNWLITSGFYRFIKVDRAERDSFGINLYLESNKIGGGKDNLGSEWNLLQKQFYSRFNKGIDDQLFSIAAMTFDVGNDSIKLFINKELSKSLFVKIYHDGERTRMEKQIIPTMDTDSVFVDISCLKLNGVSAIIENENLRTLSESIKISIENYYKINNPEIVLSRSEPSSEGIKLEAWCLRNTIVEGEDIYEKIIIDISYELLDERSFELNLTVNGMYYHASKCRAKNKNFYLNIFNKYPSKLKEQEKKLLAVIKDNFLN